MRIYTAFLVILASLGFTVLADDTAFKKEIIGVWKLGEQDRAYGKQWSRLEYLSNGKTVYHQYASSKCEKPIVTVYGSWVILNGTLVNTALSSSGKVKVPLGKTFVDKITLLKEGEMVLETDRGNTAYRSKNIACSTGN